MQVGGNVESYIGARLEVKTPPAIPTKHFIADPAAERFTALQTSHSPPHTPKNIYDLKPHIETLPTSPSAQIETDADQASATSLVEESEHSSEKKAEVSEQARQHKTEGVAKDTAQSAVSAPPQKETHASKQTADAETESTVPMGGIVEFNPTDRKASTPKQTASPPPKKVDGDELPATNAKTFAMVCVAILVGCWLVRVGSVLFPQKNG